jgi:hypothetical protein
MAFDVRLLREESVSKGASTGDARLAGLPGRGTLQVWRGQNHDVIRILGTWRQEEGGEALGTLREALDETRPVVYEGYLDDPAQAETHRVRAEVIVSSIGTYRLGEDDDSSYCFVNFTPRDPERVVG